MTTPISQMLGQVYIACVDLEATCDDSPDYDRNSMEIIEFGMTLLDREYNVVGSFNSFVRPLVNPTLTAFCKNLTTITQEQVDSAPSWAEVTLQIRDFFVDQCAYQEDPPSLIWTSWGDFDKNKIAKECIRHGVDNPMSMRHYNLKFLEAAHRNSKRQHGLRGTMDNMGLVFPGTLHRACDDAAAVAMVMEKLGPGLIRSKL